jgi:hypothetical protein
VAMTEEQDVNCALMTVMSLRAASGNCLVPGGPLASMGS